MQNYPVKNNPNIKIMNQYESTHENETKKGKNCIQHKT